MCQSHNKRTKISATEKRIRRVFNQKLLQGLVKKGKGG